MMRTRSILGWMLCMSALLSCKVQVQTYDLAKDYATTLHYEGSEGNGGEEEEDESESLAGVPAKNFYGGDLKRGGIWYGGSGISLEKGPEFILEIENVSSDSVPFGATFPPLDLIAEGVSLKLVARAESADSTKKDSPTLSVQVEDAAGYKTNLKRPSQTIENSTEYKEYYFDLKDIYAQATPKKHKVNGAMINTLKFFVNVGQTGYSGKIYIKEIKLVPVKSN